VHQDCAGLVAGGTARETKKAAAGMTYRSRNDSTRQPFEAQDEQDALRGSGQAGATPGWVSKREGRY
jgi:hypothetical protein